MKKIGIMIGILLILCIIMFCVIKTDKPNEINIPNTVTAENLQTGKIEQFEEYLKGKGITLSNKTEVTSEQINETGYAYELNGEKIEIYHVEQEKIDHLKVSTKPGFEIIIKTRDNMSMYAIYYNEILVLNCMKNSSAILNALQVQN